VLLHERVNLPCGCFNEVHSTLKRLRGISLHLQHLCCCMLLQSFLHASSDVLRMLYMSIVTQVACMRLTDSLFVALSLSSDSSGRGSFKKADTAQQGFKDLLFDVGKMAVVLEWLSRRLHRTGYEKNYEPLESQCPSLESGLQVRLWKQHSLGWGTCHYGLAGELDYVFDAG
jgi:hypothetical protein